MNHPVTKLSSAFADIKWLLAECDTLRAQLAAREGEIATLKARASKLKDAAFHFQHCRTCADDGEESCTDGQRFAAYLRGEASA